MTARQFAKHRETFCLASAGSDEEFRAYLSGFDAAVAIADLAAVPAQVRVKPLVWEEDTDGDSDDFGRLIATDTNIHVRYKVYRVYGGEWLLSGSVPFWLPRYPTEEAAKAAAQAEYEARILAATEPQPDPRELTVWYGKMPESNGRENWTAILRPKACDHMHGLLDGFCFARSEYPDRVRYEADRMRWVIGELTEKPDILAYDDDLHSGYVEQPDPRDEVIARLVDEVADLKRKLGGGCDANHGDEHTVIRQGNYFFCAECGETLKGVRYVNASPAALAAAKAVQHG